MPDLRQLRTFVAVAQELSFTRAGELLHLKQQSVSKAVRELERELGVELLERTTREVRLTAAGKALLDAGPPALAAADAAFARARDVGRGLTGKVRIACTPAIGPTDQTDVARALRESGADLSVVLQEVRPDQLRQMLRAREIDLALSRVAGTAEPTIHSAELRPTPMMLCVPRTHRLATRPDVALEDIRGERLLTASPQGTPYTDLLLARCAAAGVQVISVEARVTGGAALPAQLTANDAVALVPVGTPIPPDVTALPIHGVTVPLLVLWIAGMPSPAVDRLRGSLSPQEPSTA